MHQDLISFDDYSCGYCGCFYSQSPLAQQESFGGSLPLVSANYHIDISNSLAQVTLLQQYVNHTDKVLEISYRFPISPNVCLHKFCATFSDKRIQGQVKEKEQSKQEYIQAMKQGKKTAYGQVDPQTKDLMTLKIGNLQPKETVKVQISYIEELTLSLNTFYRFSLPVKNDPKYFNKIPKNQFKYSFRNKVSVNNYSFQWDFTIRLRSNRKVLHTQSPSHCLKTTNHNDTLTDLTLTLQHGSALDKDFIFMYTTEQFQLPSYTLGRTDAGSSALVSFIPKFCQLSLQDAKAQSMITDSLVFQTDMDAARGEYIFLLDRSGSMGGSRINKAKQALALFLRSLPVDSFFNIVSFGTTHQFLYPQSRKNNTQNIASAVQQVQSMEADYGGTVIDKPLKVTLKDKLIQGYPRQVFLLTDGEVYDTQKVIDIVRKSIKYSRVHTIGIGDGASKALIKGCAQKGKGYHIFIKDYQNPASKIIQLLSDSLTPVISQFQLTYDHNLVESIVPNPHSMPYILKNQVVNFYVTFKGQIEQSTSLCLEYQDSKHKLPFKTGIQVLPDSPSECYIDTMAHFKLMIALQECEQSGVNTDDYLYFVKNVNKRQAIINMSVKHQILSKYTAFICVQQQLIDGKYQEIKSKGTLSVDISQQIQSNGELVIDLFEDWSYGGNLSHPIPQSSTSQNNLDLLGMPQSAPNSQKCTFGISNHSLPPAFSSSLSKSLLRENSRAALPPPVLNCFSQSVSSPSAPPPPLPPGMGGFQGFKGSLPKKPIITEGKAKKSIPTSQQSNLLDFDEQIERNTPSVTSQVLNPFSFDSLIEAPELALQLTTLSQPSSLVYGIKQIVAEQSSEGFWSNLDIISFLFGDGLREAIKGKQQVLGIVTYLVLRWLQKHYPQCEYQLIRKKAHNWLKKLACWSQLPLKYDMHIK